MSEYDREYIKDIYAEGLTIGMEIEKQRHACECVVKNREDGETEREWFKRWMCMYHWMQTDYYRNKLKDDNSISQV